MSSTNLSEKTIDKINEIMISFWPLSKKKAGNLFRHYEREGNRRLSKRYNNEIRDALDHLYRVASSEIEENQIRDCNALYEHIRRATIESLEFHVEETLMKIRPVPLPRSIKDIIKTNLSWWIEYFKKLVLMRPFYTPLMLDKIIIGQKHLVEARKKKGSELEYTIKNLEESLKIFEMILDELNNNSFNSFRFVFIGIVNIAIGIILSLILKPFFV